MKIPNFIFLIVILLFSISASLAQDSETDWENWIGTIEGGQPSILLHRYDNYSQADVIKAKQKLLLLKQISPKNEWEGMYDSSGHLSDIKFIWNLQVGFIKYYIHTCQPDLRNLDFGSVKSVGDQIETISEKPQNAEAKSEPTNVKFIKVKWGDAHYLVKEEELETFCELAAGYYGTGKPVEAEINGEKFTYQKSIWDSYWKKVEEPDKKVFGLPVLPSKYKHLIKIPIETEILSINEHKLEINGESVMSYSYRYVTINGGKDKNIKTDMEFYSPDLRERIKIIEVGKKTSKGVIERWYDEEEKKEQCFNNREDIPCVIPAVRMKIKTVPDEFLETD